MPLVTLEGIEGSGKSTLMGRLATRLGDEAVVTKEPGGTAIGRAVRQVLLDPASKGMTPMAELLLYFADRAQNVAEVVRPGLDAGRVVFCDRYVESSLAYQGYGRGLPKEEILALAELATGGLRPDLIVLIDVPVEVGLQRVARRGAHDRLESEERAFHERVRQGYFELMEQEPARWVRLDGAPEPETLFASLWTVLARRGYVDEVRS
jgi:dTMP kinase